MNTPRRSGLGKGLGALIPAGIDTAPSALPPSGLVEAPVDQIAPNPRQPRDHMEPEALAELAESIRTHGLIQPLVLTLAPAGAAVQYYLVAGERRWRASQLAGLHTVPAIVKDVSPQGMLELALVENVQRADLNAIEEANGYRELIERFDYSQEQVSEIIGKSRSHVANTLRLLRLPASVQAFVQEGKLTAGHARALVGRDDAEALAQRILEQDLNVREAEALVQVGGPIGVAGASGARKAREKDPDTKAFEKELADSLGLKVEVKRGSGESGNLVIKYGNFDQLDYIRMRLTGSQGG